ncbi:hypothetical protein [Streptacidiphilus sp. EB129]|uniref:hypothetical protein n=1 Tax=Streptacidiphilus sp. EB129 TaxID=3156262 RepID=UPI00351925D4
MATSAVGYASLQGLGNVEGCVEVLRAVDRAVARFNRDAGARVADFAPLLFRSVDMLEVEAIDPEVMHKVTGGSYPVACMHVTYDPDRLPAADLVDLEREFDLRVIGRTSSQLLDLLKFESSPRSITTRCGPSPRV